MSLSIRNMNNNGMGFFFDSNATSKSSGVGLESLLGDYSTIRTGSYGKLLNSYFKKYGSDGEIKIPGKNTDADKKLSDIKAKATSLSDATDKLLEKGSKSLFNKREVVNEDGQKSVEYDKEAIYNAISDYVDAYNDMIDSGKKADGTNILIQTASISTASNSNAKLLGNIGISINADGHLSIDEKFFKEKADMNTVKDLFNGRGSYIYQVNAKAGMLETYSSNALSNDKTYNNSAMLTTSDVISSFKRDI